MKGVGNHVIQGLCSAGLILCLGGAAVAAANDNETSEKPTAQEKQEKNDTKLAKQIESRIEHDKTLKNRNINADVSRGTVTLTGTVASSSEKMRAEKLAKVKGVSDVDNEIEVQGDHASEPGASDGTMNEEKGQPQEQPQRRTQNDERSETRTDPVPAEPRTTEPTPDIENPSMPERAERPVPSPSNPAPSTPPPSNNLPSGSPSTPPPSNPTQTP